MTTKDFLIEVTDKDGYPTGEQTTLDDANNRGLWHRTAHVAIYTKDRQVLVQKRSSTIIRDPNLLDISVGAAIQVGEHPEEALVRKVYEEVGVVINSEDLVAVGTTRYNHRVPRYQKHVRVILCNYILQLQDANVPLRYLHSEVAWAGFLPLTLIAQLIQEGKIDTIGKLIPRPTFYRRLLDSVVASVDK